MQTYIRGEITITAAQLEHVKVKTRKKMRAARRHPERERRCFELNDVFGFVFTEAMADLDIYLVEDSNCDEDAGRLIVLSLDESWDLSGRQARIWKLRYRDDCTAPALDALVDELLDASIEFLQIEVSLKAPQKPTREPTKLRRVA